MTRDEVVRLGMELKRVIQTDAFNKAVDVIRHEYTSRVFDSALHEREQRDMAYQEARALDNLLSTLNSFVVIAESEALQQMAYELDGDEDINFNL